MSQKVDYEALRSKLDGMSQAELEGAITQFRARLDKIEQVKQERPDLADQLDEKKNWTNDAIRDAFFHLVWAVSGKPHDEWNKQYEQTADPAATIQEFRATEEKLEQYKQGYAGEVADSFGDQVDWFKDRRWDLFRKLAYHVLGKPHEEWQEQYEQTADPDATIQEFQAAKEKLEQFKQGYAGEVTGSFGEVIDWFKDRRWDLFRKLAYHVLGKPHEDWQEQYEQTADPDATIQEFQAAKEKLEQFKQGYAGEVTGSFGEVIDWFKDRIEELKQKAADSILDDI